MLKKLFLALMLLVCSAPAYATIAIVQQGGNDGKCGGGSGSGTTASVTISKTGVDAIAGLMLAGTSAAQTVADGDAAYSYGSGFGVVGGLYVKPFYRSGVTGTGDITLTTSSQSFPAICVITLSGVKTSGPFDVERGGSSGTPSSTASFSTVTPTENNEIVIFGGGGLSTANDTADVGTRAVMLVTSAGNNYSLSLFYSLQTTAAAIAPTITFNVSSVRGSDLFSLKAQPASSGTAPKGTLIGVLP